MSFVATKTTWAARRIPADLEVSWRPVDRPAVGDVLGCEVVTPLLHGRVETADGRRSVLYPGDRIACVLGNRYATSILKGVARVEGELIDLLSASGVCGQVVRRADKAVKPTKLRVLAQGHQEDRPLNVRSFALPAPQNGPEPTFVVVVGSAMDSGKTTACTSLIHGLRRDGYRVGAAKLTGTASSRDVVSFRDAGASPVYDFLDMGWPSTDGCTVSELSAVVAGLAGHLRAASVDIGVLEVADGLLQRETELILCALRDWVGPVKVVLAVRESLAAVAGVSQLARLGHEVLAVTGVVTGSPLAVQEVELAGVGPCLRTTDLGSQFAALLRVSDKRREAAVVA